MLDDDILMLTDDQIDTVLASGSLDMSSCLPLISGMDWGLMQETPFVFLGTGAIGRPMSLALAWLGMKQAVLVDRKKYKSQSRISQCEPEDVGREKARVVTEKLRVLGVKATAWPVDLEEIPPGVIEPNAVVIAALDNRLADAQANRLAAMMQARFVKVNVEPAFLTASLRFYDFRRSPVSICAECQMTDAHYIQQKHPLSCDGGGPEQATGSPRPLCEFAAQAAALAIAQAVCSPDRYAKAWTGMQWQQSLLGGRGGFSALAPKTHCRWDHTAHWENLTRWAGSPRDTTLRSLLAAADVGDFATARLRVSGRIATSARCNVCGDRSEQVRWVSRLNRGIGFCDCDGELFAEPFATIQCLPATRLARTLDEPLSTWSVPAYSIIAVETPHTSRSFVLGAGEGD